MERPFARPAAAILFVALLAVGVGLAGGSSILHGRSAPPRYMATPGNDTEEATSLDRLEAYWNDRLTYPTGVFNPAWVRQAAAQAERIPSRVPAGVYPSAAQSKAAGGAATGNVPLNTTDAVPLGPAPERMTGCGNCFDYTRTQGRINALAVDPTTTTNGSIVAYAGTVGGGVWKTTNCCSDTTTWSVTTDDPLITAISIDTLTIDPNDHNTIYAGTGDLNYGSFSMGSQGILKSTDGGAHWTVLGANVFGPAYGEPAGQFPQYDAVGKVRVDPNNSNDVVAGTKKGIFVSYDGGTNWTGPCAPSSFSTQRQDITGLELSNMGGGVTRILAAVGVRGFATTVQYDLGQNGANGLYTATMPAGGCPSFTSIASNANGFVFGTSVTGSPYTTGANLNAGSGDPYVSSTSGDQLGRIDVAVAPTDPNVIYAQVQSIAQNSNSGCGNTNGCELGVFASTDGGSTWSMLAGSAGGSLRNCVGTNTSGNPGDYPQNWYDQGIAVDPNNADRLFVDTYDVWLATRTGASFTNLTCGYNGSSAANHVVHVDQHALAFVPGSSGMLLLGSDGGAFGTTNADAASASPVTRPTWFNMDLGLNTIEFYSGDISGNFATSASPSAAGGAQDNAPSVAGFSGYPTGPAQWQLVTGGDGFYARIDPVGTGFGPRYFVGNNSGGLSRCSPTATNTCLASGTGYSNVRGGWTSDTQSFIFPFDLFHGGMPGGDDCSPAGVPGGCTHLVGGTTRVWETISGGNASGVSSTWYVTNFPSTQNMTKQSLGNRSFINQVKYSPKWSSVAMVGTNDANVWIGFNLGTGTAGQASWMNVTGGNAVLPNRPVLGIALDPSSPSVDTEVGYAALGGFNANTPAQPGHVFQVSCSSSCTSFNWLDKSGNLPDIPVDSVIVNPNFPQQVFAGTDFGLYFTNDVTQASPTWYRFDNGVPHAMIWDLQIDRGATTLSIWTRGRGAYVWQLPTSSVTQGQTIDFGPLANMTYGDADFNVSATASSGLPVSFGASGDCTVAGSTVHITGAGSCTITASQSGNADYEPAPDVPQTFSIGRKDLTITANDRTKLYGQTLVLGTTAFTPTGLVNGDGIAGVTLTSLGAAAGAGVGTYPIVPSDAVAAPGTDLDNYAIDYENGTLTVALAGIVGLDSASIGAKSAYIDSYDSSAGPYGGANTGSDANLLSNGKVTVDGADVYGDVRSSQGSVTLKKGSLVTGDVTAGTTIKNDGTIGGSATPGSPADPLVPAPAADCSPYSDAAGIGGAFTYTPKGDLNVKGGKTATLAAGTYCFHNITVPGGATLRAEGPVVIYLTGKLEVSGKSSLLGSSLVPADLQIMSSSSKKNDVHVADGTVYATIYAPGTGIDVGGHSVVFGSLLGRTLDLTGDAAVHYDVH